MTADTHSSFGELLRHCRTDAGLTQEELAGRAGISVRAVSDLERGVNNSPRYDTARRLARALELSADDAAAFERSARGISDHLRAVEPEPSALPTGNFLGALPAGPFVARTDELEHVLSIVDTVKEGQGRLVLLAGEPGIGKTRLAQEVTLALRDQGFLVAAGSCFEASQSTAFYPFLEIISTLVDLAPRALREAVPQQFSYLSVLLPGHRFPQTSLPGASVAEQEELFWTAAAFVRALAQDRPVALLLDDLHWADASSLALLHHLARHTRGKPILLLGTYRDVEVGRQHPLEAALRELGRQDLLERVVLHRLDEAGTAELARAAGDERAVRPEIARILYERTEGNPFFVQQVARMLAQRGELQAETGHWTGRDIDRIEVPESIRSVIGQRVGRLTEGAQQILHEASVFGQLFTFDDLMAMGGRGERALETGLEEVRGVGLLHTEDGERYRFDHALTQQTLYSELPPRSRRRLHLAAAEALDRLPARKREGRVAALAWHFLQGDDPERALTYSLLAGEASEAVYARQDAEQHYRTAHALAQELGDQVRQAEAAEKLGVLLFTLNRRPEALPLSEEAWALYGALGDVEGEMRATYGVAYAWPTNQMGTLIPRLEALLARAPETPSPGRVALLTALGAAYMWDGRDSPEIIALTEQAVPIARELGNPRAQLDALDLQAAVFAADRRRDEAKAAYQRVAEVSEAVGDTFYLPSALILHGYLCHIDRDHDAAVAATKRGLAIARQTGDTICVALGTINLGEIAFDLGDWEQAEYYFTEAVPYGAVRGATTDPDANLLYLRLLRGEREAVPELARLADDPSSWAARYLAESELLDGALDVARGRLEAALDAGIEAHHRQGWEALLAETYLALGDVDLADSLASASLEHAPGAGYPADPVQCRRVVAMSRSAQARWDEANTLFAGALAEAEGFPFVQAHVHHHFGCSLRSRGDNAASRVHLEAALALFNRLGARVYAVRTEASLGAAEPS